MSNVWFITGAGRGMGVDIAKAALAAGHNVVGTGRNTGKVSAALAPARLAPAITKVRSSLTLSPSVISDRADQQPGQAQGEQT